MRLFIRPSRRARNWRRSFVAVGCLSLGCLSLGAAVAQPATPTQAQAGKPPTAAAQAGQDLPEVKPPSAALNDLASQLDKTPDVIVAEVAGTPITLGMVAEGMRSLPAVWGSAPSREVFDFVLTGLVNMRVLALKATQLGIDKDPVARRRVEMAADRELASALMKNVTDAKLTDKALQEQYDKDFAGKAGPEEVWLRVIGANSKASAEAALAAIEGGMDFASAVREFSHDPTKDAGGDLGYVTAESLPEELRAVAFALPPGQMSAYPLQSNGFWYILEVEGRRRRPPPPIKDVAKQLKDEISVDAARDYILRTRDGTTIKIYGPAGVGAGETTAKPSQ